MTAARTARVGRLSEADREAMLRGFACSRAELDPWEPRPRKERARPPAPPHAYRSTTIYDIPNNESIVRCRVRDCQDERHATMARLGVVR